MPRTLSDEDVEAIAQRVVAIMAAKFAAPAAPSKRPEPDAELQGRLTRLAYTAAEVAAELGVSKVTLWRLEQRGLLRSVPGIRRKIYARAEIERMLTARKERGD